MRRLLGSLIIFAALGGGLTVGEGQGLASPRQRIRARANSKLNLQQPSVAWGHAAGALQRPGQLPAGTIVRLPGPLGEIGRIPRRLPGRGIHLPQQLPHGTVVTVPARLPHPRGVGDRPVSLPGRGNPFPVVLTPTR